MPPYTLRPATPQDAEFLFNVKVVAMEPVFALMNPGETFDREEETDLYLKSFEADKIQVIQYEGKDVGRLRVVRTLESIYIGGVQILPEYQGKGIGTALFNDLIAESNASGIPIVLEVHHVNVKAIGFYLKLGFEETERNDKQIILRYKPKGMSVAILGE